MRKQFFNVLALVLFGCCFSACAPQKEQSTKPVGHSCSEHLVKNRAVESTCTGQGHKEYYECSQCGLKYSDGAASNSVTAESLVLPYAPHLLALCNETVGGYTDFYYCENCQSYFEDKEGIKQIVSAEIEQYGRLGVSDIYAWINYPASEFTIKFTGDEESLTYDYDKTKLTVDVENKTVSALAEGEHTVTVISEHHRKSFNVTCNSVEKKTTDLRWQVYNESQASYYNSQYKLSGKNGKTTVFVGDSFFDKSYFWTDFSKVFKGKDVICAGISSTTTYDWENYMLDKTFLVDIFPKNIVVNIGTNNFYDDCDGKDLTIENLQRIFTLMHSLMPDTNIYYFSIAQRTDPAFKTDVTQTNAAIMEWCKYKSWITFIDVESKINGTNLRDDGIHPALAAYQTVYVKELERAGCVIA